MCCPLLQRPSRPTLATPPPDKNQDSSWSVKVSAKSTPSNVTAPMNVQKGQHTGTDDQSTLKNIQEELVVCSCRQVAHTNSSMGCFGCQVGLAAFVSTDGAQAIGPFHGCNRSPRWPALTVYCSQVCSFCETVLIRTGIIDLRVMRYCNWIGWLFWSLCAWIQPNQHRQ